MLKRRDFLALSGAGTAALALGARPNIGAAQDLYEPQDTYGPRAALIIGNGNYAAAPKLPNPVNDARSISAVLSEIGFDVSHAEDADFGTMRKATDDVSRRFPRGGVGLIYYAEHAREDVRANAEYARQLAQRLAREGRV